MSQWSQSSKVLCAFLKRKIIIWTCAFVVGFISFPLSFSTFLWDLSNFEQFPNQQIIWNGLLKLVCYSQKSFYVEVVALVSSDQPWNRQMPWSWKSHSFNKSKSIIIITQFLLVLQKSFVLSYICVCDKLVHRTLSSEIEVNTDENGLVTWM